MFVCSGVSNGSCWYCGQRCHYIPAGKPAAGIQENGIAFEVSGHCSNTFAGIHTKHDLISAVPVFVQLVELQLLVIVTTKY